MFSSFAILNMSVYFLQIIKVLPSIQKIKWNEKDNPGSFLNIKRKTNFGNFQEFTTRIDFETDLSIINNNFKPKLENITLMKLFIGFLEFYNENGFFLTNKLRVNIIEGDIDYLNSNDKDEESILYSIKDPFDLMHNPGNRIRKGDQEKIKRIFMAINKTLDAINNGTLDEELQNIF